MLGRNGEGAEQGGREGKATWNKKRQYLIVPIFFFFFYTDLYEEKAILLSRIGQHDQALNIYVYKLKNYRMAEECVLWYICVVRPRGD